MKTLVLSLLFACAVASAQCFESCSVPGQEGVFLVPCGMCGSGSGGIGPGTLNCPGDCGCVGSENNPNCARIRQDGGEALVKPFKRTAVVAGLGFTPITVKPEPSSDVKRLNLAPAGDDDQDCYQICASGEWKLCSQSCGIGPGTLNCPGDCGCPNAPGNNPNCPPQQQGFTSLKPFTPLTSCAQKPKTVTEARVEAPETATASPRIVSRP